MKIFLIRHGRTEANEKWLYCGSTDLPLSEKGVEAIKNCAKKYPFAEKYYTSGMKRANQTFELIYGKIAYEEIPALREMDFGIFEMRAYDELKNEAQYQEWISGENEKNICPDGESGEQMKQRVIAAFHAVIDEKKDAVIVAHGGVIAAIMEYLFPDERKNRYDWQPASAEGYAIEFGKEKRYWKIP